jgi:general secretion pathway protein D
VEDGQTVVIAGLMKSNSRNSNSGIPFLKDIPILGYLFGGASQEMQKTELIIMITPHVIKNRTDAETITWEFSNKIKTLQRDKILSNP